MFRLVRLLFVLLILALFALPIIVVMVAVEDAPLVNVSGDPDYRDLERAQDLLEKNDPRRMPPGSTQTLVLSGEDINVMLRYGLSRLGGGGSTVNMEPDGLSVYLTAALPRNPLGSWLNIHAGLRQAGQGLRVDALEIGRLHIPGTLANWLVQLGGRQLGGDSLYRAVIDSVDQLQFTGSSIAITYQWQPELVEQVRARGSEVLISAADRERLLAYTEAITSATNGAGIASGASMDRIMGPLFALAGQRSRQGDAAAENRALLAALAIYINGLNLGRLIDVPDDKRYHTRRMTLTLGRREDLTQHFSISAVMAATGGSALADAVGLSKEVKDADGGGSGFSFTDLAADRAGVRFAEAATGNSAAKIQALLASGKGEGAYMPSVQGLPEFMGAQKFARVYGSVGSPAYNAVAQDIEQRISNLPVHSL